MGSVFYADYVELVILLTGYSRILVAVACFWSEYLCVGFE